MVKKSKKENIMGSQVAIINESTVVSDADLQKFVTALQTQVGRDYAPIWGRYAKLTMIPKGGTPPPDQWWLAVLDNSDVSSALGYHEITDNGLPLGKVFAKDDLTNGDSVSVTISHELLEMLGNPFINLTAFDINANTLQQIFMHEMCDPCEADNLGYQIKGIQVSDFLLPAWFEPSVNTGGKLTFNNTITQPLTLAPGGYMSYYDLQQNKWMQKDAFGGRKLLHEVAKEGTRKHRIAQRHSVWRKSQRLANSVGQK